MEVRLSLLLLGTLLTDLASAGQGFAPDGWRTDRGVLFRIVSIRNALHGAAVPTPTSSLILGTLHFGSPQELGLRPQRLQQEIGLMDTFIAEVDDCEPWSPGLQRYRLLDGVTLPKLIGTARFARLRQLLPQHSTEQLRYLRPWVVLSLLEARGEIPTQVPLDEHLQQWARQAGLEVRALEKLEQQLAALNCVPPEEQALVLRQRLDRPNELAAQSARVLNYYRTGDLPAWLAEVIASPGLDRHGAALEARSRRCLLEERNQRWLRTLVKELRQGGVFVAVGALHLTGPRGLLEGLRRHGYAIYPEPW